MFSQQLVLLKGRGYALSYHGKTQRTVTLVPWSWPVTVRACGQYLVTFMLGEKLLVSPPSSGHPECWESGPGPPSVPLPTGFSRLTQLVPPLPTPALPVSWLSPRSTTPRILTSRVTLLFMAGGLVHTVEQACSLSAWIWVPGRCLVNVDDSFTYFRYLTMLSSYLVYTGKVNNSSWIQINCSRGQLPWLD